MTIIIQGPDWHVEYHITANIILPVGAGQIDSTLIPVNKSGRLLGAMCFIENTSIDNDATQAIAFVSCLLDGSNPMVFGTVINNVIGRVSKIASVNTAIVQVGILLIIGK